MQIGGKLIHFSEIGEMVNFVEIAGVRYASLT